MLDRIKEMYFKQLRERDFNYMERGIRSDKEGELLVAGNLEYSKKLNKIVMKKPQLVIGSDRLELYEHFGRRKEALGLQNRNWLKFCIAITAVHFLIVRVPTLFSRFFGDSISSNEQKLGAEDESDLARKIAVMKQRKEI